MIAQFYYLGGGEISGSVGRGFSEFGGSENGGGFSAGRSDGNYNNIDKVFKYQSGVNKYKYLIARKYAIKQFTNNQSNNDETGISENTQEASDIDARMYRNDGRLTDKAHNNTNFHYPSVTSNLYNNVTRYGLTRQQNILFNKKTQLQRKMIKNKMLQLYFKKYKNTNAFDASNEVIETERLNNPKQNQIYEREKKFKQTGTSFFENLEYCRIYSHYDFHSKAFQSHMVSEINFSTF